MYKMNAFALISGHFFEKSDEPVSDPKASKHKSNPICNEKIKNRMRVCSGKVGSLDPMQDSSR